MNANTYKSKIRQNVFSLFPDVLFNGCRLWDPMYVFEDSCQFFHSESIPNKIATMAHFIQKFKQAAEQTLYLLVDAKIYFICIDKIHFSLGSKHKTQEMRVYQTIKNYCKKHEIQCPPLDVLKEINPEEKIINNFFRMSNININLDEFFDLQRAFDSDTWKLILCEKPLLHQAIRRICKILLNKHHPLCLKPPDGKAIIIDGHNLTVSDLLEINIDTQGITDDMIVYRTPIQVISLNTMDYVESQEEEEEEEISVVKLKKEADKLNIDYHMMLVRNYENQIGEADFLPFFYLNKLETPGMTAEIHSTDTDMLWISLMWFFKMHENPLKYSKLTTTKLYWRKNPKVDYLLYQSEFIDERVINAATTEWVDLRKLFNNIKTCNINIQYYKYLNESQNTNKKKKNKTTGDDSFTNSMKEDKSIDMDFSITEHLKKRQKTHTSEHELRNHFSFSSDILSFILVLVIGGCDYINSIKNLPSKHFFHAWITWGDCYIRPIVYATKKKDFEDISINGEAFLRLYKCAWYEKNKTTSRCKSKTPIKNPLPSFVDPKKLLDASSLSAHMLHCINYLKILFQVGSHKITESQFIQHHGKPILSFSPFSFLFICRLPKGVQRICQKNKHCIIGFCVNSYSQKLIYKYYYYVSLLKK